MVHLLFPVQPLYLSRLCGFIDGRLHHRDAEGMEGMHCYTCSHFQPLYPLWFSITGKRGRPAASVMGDRLHPVGDLAWTTCRVASTL
ncbi:MAG: hypothetical protein KatS3mg058_3131 [Roseiflexus sp.]|nr:MAG: hypothetical protein KatS3mg058_3131 [Roseiflexus sp.]